MFEVDSLYKRLTPAHISLSAWSPIRSINVAKYSQVKENLSPTLGRYYVAAEPLKQGDIVLKEEPFIRQLNYKLRHDHCYSCFRHLTTTPVTCHVQSCCWHIVYCNSTCEKKGWSSGHAWSCRFPELDDPELQDVLFAFEGYIAGRSKGSGVLPGLVSNLELNHAAVAEYKRKINKIAPLFYLSDFIIDTMVCIFSQIRCNTFAIKQAASVPVDSSFVVSRESIHLGQAIYLSASHFNHACDPTALVTFGGDGNPSQLQVQSIKGGISVGHDVSISYGPLATKHTKEERKKKLNEDYFFDCQCSSCQEKSEDRPNSPYKCQICKTGRLYRQQEKCRQCDQDPYWAYFLKTEAEIEQYAQQRDFLKMLQLQETIYHDDTLKIGETLDRLAQVYCASGQMQLAAKYSKRSLEVTQKIYGKRSVEAAEEMMKLSALLCNSMQKADALKQINETMVVYKILGLNKSSPEDIEELEEMKNYLLYIAR